jgi:hypothetical protein
MYLILRHLLYSIVINFYFLHKRFFNLILFFISPSNQTNTRAVSLICRPTCVVRKYDIYLLTSFSHSLNSRKSNSAGTFVTCDGTLRNNIKIDIIISISVGKTLWFTYVQRRYDRTIKDRLTSAN